MPDLELIEFGGPLLKRLRSAGLTPEIELDYDKIAEREQLLGKDYSQPMMSINRNDFVKGEAFWLFLKQGDKDLACLGAKFIDLSNETLEAYLRRTSKQQYNYSTDPIQIIDPMVGMLRGKMCYVGELYVEKSIRGAIRTLATYARLMQLLAYSDWDFDWMYGFVTDEHIKLNRLYKFSAEIRSAITWSTPEPKGRLSSHAMLASSRRQIRLILEED